MSDIHGGEPTIPIEAIPPPLGTEQLPLGPPPPIAPPPPSYYAAPASPPPRRRRRVATSIAVALAVVAGGFAIMQLTAADGPRSPEEAVRAFFDAVDHEDVIGVIESLDPRERQILRDAVDSTKAEASRTQVASDNLDLRHVQGVDVRVTGLQMGVTPLRDGLSAVDLADGSVSSSADLDRMAIGPVIRDVLQRRDKDPDLSNEDRKADGDIDLRGVRLATTRTDGAWHVSVLYSIAEQVRTDGDHAKPFPTGDPIPANGADSPEAAVRQAVDAVVHHDAQRLIELSAPGEMDVLHTYGPLIVDAAKEGWAKDEKNITVSDLGLATADGPRGSKVVSATSFKMHSVDDYGEGDNGTTDITYDGTCTTYESTWTYSSSFEEYGPDGEPIDGGEPAEPDPQTDTQKWCEGDDTTTTSGGVLPFTFFSPFFFGGGSGSELRVVTEEHDGAWFVSPSRSIFESALSSLRALSVDDARRMTRAWFGDEFWLLSPPEFWKACKMTQPGLDATRAEGEQAEQDCADALPDDYEGPWGFGSVSRKFNEVGTRIDSGSGFDDSGLGAGDDPTAVCDDAPAVNEADGAYDAAYHACLQWLFDEGKLDGQTLLGDTCNQAWNEWFNTKDGEPSEAESKALDDAYEACVDAGPVPTRPDGSSGVTVVPDGAARRGPKVPASATPPTATTAPTDPTGPSTIEPDPGG